MDREKQTIWKWDPDRFRLLLASGEGFLFAEMGKSGGADKLRETGRLIWTDGEMNPRKTFDLGLVAPTSLQALLSPNGRQVALLYKDPPQVLLLALESGTG